MNSKIRPYVVLYPLIGIWLLVIARPLLTSFKDPAPVLPPSLKQLLHHAPSVTYPAPETPPEWKRPLTLTVHATSKNDTVQMTLFTTGVDIERIGRSFTSVGCLVGSHALPAISLRPAVVTCAIRRELLSDGMSVTVLIKHDEAVADALKGETQTLGGETFSFQEGDVKPLAETPKELNDTGKVAAIRTLVKWDDRFIDRATGTRYELCLMTAMRQYPFLLKDWISFYRRMGVDKIYIYENWATEDLDKLVGSEFVEVVRWPWVRSQMQSNNHFLLASKTRCKYAAFFDADEFTMVGGEVQENSLKKYIRLRVSQGYNQVIFLFLMMLNNGYIRRPKGALPDLYTRREKDQVLGLGKPVIITDVGWDRHNIHAVRKGKGSMNRTYWNKTMVLEPSTVGDNAMLVHYTKRSWEDYVLKHRIGGASVLTKGRPKKILDVGQPDEDYMDLEKSVEFSGFRKRWKEIMKLRDHGEITLVRSEEAFICRRRWCPRCQFSSLQKLGKEECMPDLQKDSI